MIRSSIAIWVAAVAALAVLGARDARADNPRERQCQPNIEAAVRAAFPSARPGIEGVRCPVFGPEYRIVNGQSIPIATDAVKAEAVLADGRVMAVTVELSHGDKGNEVAKVQSITSPHSDLVDSSGKGMAVVFWLFALISVAGAVFVISRKNLIAAVMGMVGSFFGIAAVYMLLYAQFLAIVQMLVYAGAIMVLFVFVIMILNRPEDEPVAPSGRAGQVIGGLAILYLVARLILILMHVEPPNAAIANAAPPPTALGYDWGSVAAVGNDLFNGGLFPFEAISILLLVAVVGAIAIARPLAPGEDAGDDDPTRTPGHPASTHSQGGAA
ncbi:MAG TPA: NADH-quinone oxidoreductase subunit J [Kofleriaceae bacterium]